MMIAKIDRFSLLLLLLVMLVTSRASAQCNSMISDWAVCGNDTFTVSAYIPPGSHLRFSFQPSGPLVIHRTPTSYDLTYRNDDWRASISYQVFAIDVYDSIANCYYTIEQDHRFPGHTGTGTHNFTACSPVGTIETIVFNRHTPTSVLAPVITPTVVGGTVVHRGTWPLSNNTMSTDTFDIQWTSMANREFRVQLHFSHAPVAAPISTFCDAEYTFRPQGAPEITGSDHLCDPGQAGYSVPADPNATFVWSITNGTILSGQGTSAVVVDWVSPGTIKVEKAFTSCPAGIMTDSMNVTMGRPSLNLGPNLTLCSPQAVTLDAGPGTYLHQWSTGEITRSITVNAPGLYSCSIADGHGCSTIDYVQITQVPDCVWPGDANDDNIADQVDALSIGSYMGATGPARASVSINWQGYAATNWSGTIPGLANPKFADCNGDGTVAYDDTLAITANFGQSHPKANAVSTAGVALRLVAVQDTIAPGDLATFELHLGSATAPEDSIYGLAMRLGIDPSNTVATTRFIDMDNCWFAPLGSQLTLTKPVGGEAVMAVSRVDGQQQTGGGLVATIGLASNASGMAQVYLRPSILDVFLTDGQGNSLPVSLQLDSVLVDPNYLAAADPRDVLFSVFPNPAGSQLQVVVENADLQALQLLDVTGREVLHVDSPVGREQSLDVAALPAGTYLLRLSTSRGPLNRKVVVQH